MRRSTMAGAAMALLIVASWMATTGAVNAADVLVETDLVVGGPDVLPLGAPLGTTGTLKDTNKNLHTGLVDPNLVNAWGITWGVTPTSPNGTPFWVSDNNSGHSTLYNVTLGTPPMAKINPLV